MNQPAQSVQMPQSPRHYPANLPQYAIPPQPPPFPPPYGAPPIPPYYAYPDPYQMAGPSNQMMPYAIHPPYYPPHPHYMYPLPPPPQPHIPYPPPSPRQFDSQRISDFPRQNGGSPHRGPRNFARNNNTHSPHLLPTKNFRHAFSRPAKLASPVALVPSSPFPLQTATSLLPPSDLPPSVVDTTPPPAPDIPPSLDDAAPNTEEPRDAMSSGETSTPATISANTVASPSVPVGKILPPKLEGPVGLSDASTASANPRTSYAILNSRPDDPSKAHSLMFSYRSKPPQSVFEHADHVENFNPRIRVGGERFSSSGGITSGSAKVPHGSNPNKHAGVLIPALELAPELELEPTGEADRAPVPKTSEPTSPTTTMTSIAPAIAVAMEEAQSETPQPGSSENSLTAPATPTVSSSVQSSAAVTPTSHTPSPSSPISTATSISTYPSPSASKVTPTASTVAPTLAPSKLAIRSWADLFAKPSTPSKLGSGSSEPRAESPYAAAGETVKSENSCTANVGTGLATENIPPSSGPAAESSHPSTSTRRTSASDVSVHFASLSTFGGGAVPPLHILLTCSPPLYPPAPLTHPRGLVNTGNMCFANVVMQALLHTPPFYKLFEMMGHALSGDLGRRALIDATIIFLRDFPLESTMLPVEKPPSGTTTPLSNEQLRQLSWQESFVPQFLYDAMSENKRFDSMRGGRQEDAEEFLGFFLDTLHEELLSALSQLQTNPPPSSAEWAAASSSPSSRKLGEEREVQRPLSPAGVDNNDGWLEVGKKNRVTQTRTTKARDSAITRMFGGKLRSILHTPGSGKDSITLEPYQPLQLDIQSEHVRTIEDALMHLTQPETVQVHSGTRGGLVDASKQVLIETLPPILVVHVKRFLYDLHGGVQKSSKPLLYKTILEVPRDVLSPNQRGAPPPRYRLYAVIYHHGKSASGGHYTIDVLRQDHSEWLRIDDTHIEAVTEFDVELTSPAKISRKDRAAYLLFYQRVPDNPTSPGSRVPLRQQQYARRRAPPLPQAQGNVSEA